MREQVGRESERYSEKKRENDAHSELATRNIKDGVKSCNRKLLICIFSTNSRLINFPDAFWSSEKSQFTFSRFFSFRIFLEKATNEEKKLYL